MKWGRLPWGGITYAGASRLGVKNPKIETDTSWREMKGLTGGRKKIFWRKKKAVEYVDMEEGGKNVKGKGNTYIQLQAFCDLLRTAVWVDEFSLARTQLLREEIIQGT